MNLSDRLKIYYKQNPSFLRSKAPYPPEYRADLFEYRFLVSLVCDRGEAFSYLKSLDVRYLFCAN